MDRTVVVTGADRGLGFALCGLLLEQGWRVFAGQYMPDWPDLARLAAQHPERLAIVPLDVSSIESVQGAASWIAGLTDHLDLLISNAGITGGHQEPGAGLDYAAMHHAFDVNALGAIRLVSCFLPLMEQGMRRLAFVSSEAGSISLSHREGGFGYCMSKAALNMAVTIMFNDLRPAGYTFRLYHPGWMRSYMSGQKSTRAEFEPEESAARAVPFFLGDREDEDRLVMVDYQGEEWPF